MATLARQKRGLKAHKNGAAVEGLAVLLLRLKGYRILGRRLRTPFGEVDVLAQKGGALVVVEVKARANDAAAHEAILFAQRQRLLNAAQYLAAHRTPAPASIRCDAFLFGGRGFPRHIRNAFEA